MTSTFDKLRHLALATPDVEICGFLLWDGRINMEVVPARNIADFPQTEVEIHPDDTLAAYKSGRMLAIYHSHTNQSLPRFSEIDVAYSCMLDTPMFLYAMRDNSFHFYRQRETIPALEGRKFVVGFSDCVSLVSDYYLKNFAVDLPFIERTVETMRTGFPKVQRVLQDAGFHLVKDKVLDEGDILAFKVGGSSDINHVGIHQGDGWLLHHPFNSVSLVTRIPSDWQPMMQIFRK